MSSEGRREEKTAEDRGTPILSWEGLYQRFRAGWALNSCPTTMGLLLGQPREERLLSALPRAKVRQSRGVPST